MISPVTLASLNPAGGTNKLTLQGLDNARRKSFEIGRLTGIVSRSFYFFSLPSFRAFVKGYILFQISNNCLMVSKFLVLCFRGGCHEFIILPFLLALKTGGRCFMCLQRHQLIVYLIKLTRETNVFDTHAEFLPS